MPKSPAQQVKAEAKPFISRIMMNGLKGRVLYLPPPRAKRRQILFVYGHHSSLERWWGLLLELNQFGGVTAPDLPGFGGMDSFYKIGSTPTIDNLADYLAAFIKLRYKRQKITIVGMSLGFVVATRMLQNHPDMTDKVEYLISAAGFVHHEDFTFSPARKRSYLMLSGIFKRRYPAKFFRRIVLHPFVLRLAYRQTHNAKQKFSDVERNDHKYMMAMEIELWHNNEVRTYMQTANDFLKLDNSGRPVNLTVWHISVSSDRYFDNELVEQHLRMVFKSVKMLRAKIRSHAPTVVADRVAAADLLPTRLRKLLNKN